VAALPVFHLSFPVASLDAALDFYTRCLGATPGRRTEDWCDVLLFGHQLTLHEQPAQVLPRAQRGVRHFGAILDEATFAAVRARLETHAPPAPAVHSLREAGTPREHAKLLVEDPDGNLVELKAYRDAATVLEPR
jgi:extradiol dioxygenase family protein